MARRRKALPLHCSWNWDRHGKKRVRFRQHGFSTYLTGQPWSDDFMRQYAQALDGVKFRRENIGIERTKPGSINAAIVGFYRSPEFKGLKASTQRVRKGIIERFRAEHGEKPIRLLGRNHVKAIIGAMSGTPEAANNLLKALRVLLAFAVDQEMVKENVATGIKKYKSQSDGIHTWTEDEIATFEVFHPVGSKPRLAQALLLFTGQRRSDAVKMGWQHVSGGTISVRQEKTGASLVIPIHPDLQAVINAVPKGNLTFLLTEYGAPFSSAGFGNWFRAQCNAAGLPQCSAHGLRKAAATRLANAGCSTDEVKAITGHRSLSEVARYTRAADQARLARQAMSKQVGAESEQKLSNLSTRLDKTVAK